jgi:flagellar motility protein MotE (MotC chaperone)
VKPLASDETRSDEGKDKKRKRGGRKWIPILIFLLVAGAGAGAWWLNVFHVRDTLHVALAKMPLIGALIAPIETEFSSLDKDELILQIQGLRADLENAEQELQETRALLDEDASVIKNLQRYADQQQQFVEAKAAFEQNVMKQDPQAFAEYYASMYKEDADKLYPQAAKETQNADNLKKYANLFTNMDESNAAAALEQLIPTDMNLVVTIMSHMDNNLAGDILSAMDPKHAASVIKMMAPRTGE